MDPSRSNGSDPDRQIIEKEIRDLKRRLMILERALAAPPIKRTPAPPAQSSPKPIRNLSRRVA